MKKSLPVLYFEFCTGQRELLEVSDPLTRIDSPKSVGTMTGEKFPIRCIWEAHHDLPRMQTSGSAGIDLPARIAPSQYEVTLNPGESHIFDTGLYIELPEGIVMDVRSRSGLAFKYGVHVLHGIGTVDSDYRGEVKVVLLNSGKEPYTVRDGDRIAQLVFLPYLPVQLQPVSQLSTTKRGNGGFGSTGK